MTLLFSFPGYEDLALKINEQLNFDVGDVTIRHFPDGESFVKINTDVKDKNIIVVCGLDSPDQKIMPLMFFSQVAREFGARRVGLIAPYLGYMRQDKRFSPGEAVTSNIFARFLSQHVDWLVTVDPHLHRHKSLHEIYSIPTNIVNAEDGIASWIKDTIQNPVLIGPDCESEQWVSDIAHKAHAPYIILTKIRHGDKDVEISFPKIEQYKNHTPVLIDDIISTGTTMINTVQHLYKAEMPPSVCIAIHALFVEDAYNQLKKAGAKSIVTCNTVKHESNTIDISGLLAKTIKEIIEEKK